VRHLDTFQEPLQGQLVRHQLRAIDASVHQVLNRQRVRVRPQMSTVNVELLLISDDRPVDSHRPRMHAELDHGAQFPQHLQALTDRRPGAGGLNIDITTIAIRQIHHTLNGVTLADIDGQIGSHLERHFQTMRLDIERDQQPRALEPRHTDDAETNGAHSRHHHHITELDLAALCGMDRAGHGLNECRLAGRQGSRHPVHDRAGRKDHVFRPGTLRAIANKAIDIVPLAHPILPTTAKATLPAGHDLLGDGMVAYGEACALARSLAQRHHLTDKLMPWRHRRDNVWRDLLRAPHPRAGKGLDVTGADACSEHAHQHFPGPGPGYWYGLKAIVPNPVYTHGSHRLWQWHRSTLLFPYAWPRTSSGLDYPAQPKAPAVPWSIASARRTALNPENRAWWSAPGCSVR